MNRRGCYHLEEAFQVVFSLCSCSFSSWTGSIFVVRPAAAVGVIGSWGYVEVDEVLSKPSPGGYS